MSFQGLWDNVKVHDQNFQSAYIFKFAKAWGMMNNPNGQQQQK